MEKLSLLPNIGTELERQLNEIGVTTYEQLKEQGAEGAWLKILAIDSSACANRLYALEGAINGIPKKLISDEKKVELKEFYKWHKK